MLRVDSILNFPIGYFNNITCYSFYKAVHIYLLEILLKIEERYI